VVRAGFHAWETKKLLTILAVIQCEVMVQQTRFTLPNEEFAFWKLADERVNRTHMINVSVCQNDATDGRTLAIRCAPDAKSGATKAGVDESESIVFLHQKAINHAKASQTKEVF